MRTRLTLGALALALALGGPLRADTVLLKDGRELEGQVIDRGDDTIELVQPLGSLPIARKDIVRISIDEKAKRVQRDYDVVVLRDGNYVQGDVSLSPDGAEVIVKRGQRGLVKHPRADVAAIHYRDGREEVTDPAQPGTKPLQEKVERLLDDLRRVDGAGKPDHATRGEARRELLAIGVFARKLLQGQKDGPRKEAAQEVLADLRRLEDVRRTVPSKLEEKLPRLAERLISPLPTEREAALRAVVMESPQDSGPLLLYMVKNDGEARLRAYAVSQLAALRRFEELAEVLKVPHGPLRLAAAFALGDCGIYVGIPILIEALRIDDLEIRTAAVSKLREYTKQHFGYRPKSPAEDREKAIAKWNDWWIKEGKALAAQSVKEAAPNLEGAKVSDAEREAARKLWRQASDLLSAANQPPALEGKTEVEVQKALAEHAKARRASLEKALAFLDRALELDPGLSSARMTRATLYYEELDRPEAARKELLALLNRAAHDADDPDVARKFAHLHLGRLAMRRKAWREASVAFGQALDYDPRLLEARTGQGDASFELGLSEKIEGSEEARQAAGKRRDEAFQAAYEAYKGALEILRAKDKEMLELVQGLRGHQKGVEESQVIQAVRRNRRGLEVESADVHFRIGRLFAARTRDADALTSYREALRLDPENERYKRAVEFWERLTSKQGK
ncbi:MAG: hypothetical protein AB7N76_14220 [Planctomycetota bacterium]